MLQNKKIVPTLNELVSILQIEETNAKLCTLSRNDKALVMYI